MAQVHQLTPNKNLLGVRTTLVSEMCQTLFFPVPTQKEKIAVWPRETTVKLVFRLVIAEVIYE